MDIQEFLTQKFLNWHPASPNMVSRSKYDVTLTWSQLDQPFGFLEDQLLYRVEKKEKVPPWVVVYSGGNTTKRIDNLAPSLPHKFKVQVILKAAAVPKLADIALQHFGDEDTVFNHFNHEIDLVDTIDRRNETTKVIDTKQECFGGGDERQIKKVSRKDRTIEADVEDKLLEIKVKNTSFIHTPSSKPWLESQWSEEVWTATDSEGPSVICFCMAVRCGYLKQVQQMLDERPQLIEIINSVNGLTPLITAIRKGDLTTVRFLIASGADLNQKSTAGQTPLQMAVYAGKLLIAELLIEKGADVRARDLNGLRVEHYSVDSGLVSAVRFVFDRGGDLTVRDSNGWTPLFRAILQSASLELIEELIIRGADTTATDYAGLTIPKAARLLSPKRRYPRDAVIRLVDPSYPHEQAVTHFTRLTKKISSIQTVFK